MVHRPPSHPWATFGVENNSTQESQKKKGTKFKLGSIIPPHQAIIGIESNLAYES
jgi:hypothetical protein